MYAIRISNQISDALEYVYGHVLLVSSPALVVGTPRVQRTPLLFKLGRSLKRAGKAVAQGLGKAITAQAEARVRHLDRARTSW